MLARSMTSYDVIWPHCSNFVGNHDMRYHYVSFGIPRVTWWRHQMETFSALLTLFAGNSPVIGEFPAQRPVTRSFDVSFHLRLYKRLSKQSWGWWFETPSCSLWRHCNDEWDQLGLRPVSNLNMSYCTICSCLMRELALSCMNLNGHCHLRVRRGFAIRRWN